MRGGIFLKEKHKEASHYKKLEDNKVQCFLCPHHCIIGEGKKGLCQVRQNIGGSLFTLNYERVASAHFDPIEKKPLYHFYPGSIILSLGTLGCNFSCLFCQNYDISQLPRKREEEYINAMTRKMASDEVVLIAQKEKSRGNIGVAYTYNEPSIWFEYVLECSKKIKKAGLYNVLVTNGFLEKEPLEELLPYIDAVNVDIKSISDSFYKKLCGGRRDPVLEYCKRVKEKALVEVTNLLVTGENDSPKEIEKLVDWVAKELGRDTPIHFSAYFPRYKFTAPPTSIQTLAKAYEIAIKKLDYVYVGNVWDDTWSHTRCPSCHKVVIERRGYHITAVNLVDGNHCKYCKAKVSVII